MRDLRWLIDWLTRISAVIRFDRRATSFDDAGWDGMGWNGMCGIRRIETSPRSRPSCLTGTLRWPTCSRPSPRTSTTRRARSTMATRSSGQSRRAPATSSRSHSSIRPSSSPGERERLYLLNVLLHTHYLCGQIRVVTYKYCRYEYYELLFWFRYRVISGNMDHPGDICRDSCAMLEVLPYTHDKPLSSSSEKLRRIIMQKCVTLYFSIPRKINS